MKYKEKNKKGKNIWSKFEQPTVVKSVLFTRFKFSWVEHSHFETPARAPRKKKYVFESSVSGEHPCMPGRFSPSGNYCKQDANHQCRIQNQGNGWPLKRGG